MTAPQWAATDDTTADLLAEVAAAEARGTYPDAGEQWAMFTRALRMVADLDGCVSQNAMRPLLVGKVEPQRVGPFYRRACLAGLIRVTGWDLSTDTHGKNAGKPCKKYELTDVGR